MVSADNKTTTSSAGHGHKAAVAAVADGAETPKRIAEPAVNLGHAKAMLESKQRQTANVASRTTTSYAERGH